MRKLVFILMLFGTSVSPLARAASAQGTLGLQYDLMMTDGTNLKGIAVDYDTPVHGGGITLAAGATFVRTTGTATVYETLYQSGLPFFVPTEQEFSVSRTFFGAGPGIRRDAGGFEIYAHVLIGYGRDMHDNTSVGGLDGYLAGGIDYPLGTRYRLRGGLAYSGNLHANIGVALRF